MHKFEDEIENLVKEEGKVLSNNNTIYFFGDVTPNSAGNFIACLKEVDAIVDKGINIFLCSHGGWAEGGLAMYDAIKSCNNKITTHALGAVYSAAVLPFIAGDVRIVSKNSTLLLHDMSVSMSDTTLSELKNIERESSKIFNLICGVVMFETGLNRKKVEELTKAEAFLTANESLKYNLADRISTNKRKRK